MLVIVMYVLTFPDVVSVLAGGSYIRCFNAVSGSLLWEQSVPSAEPNHHASLQFIGAGKSFCCLAIMPPCLRKARPVTFSNNIQKYASTSIIFGT